MAPMHSDLENGLRSDSEGKNIVIFVKVHFPLNLSAKCPLMAKLPSDLNEDKRHVILFFIIIFWISYWNIKWQIHCWSLLLHVCGILSSFGMSLAPFAIEASVLLQPQLQFHHGLKNILYEVYIKVRNKYLCSYLWSYKLDSSANPAQWKKMI